MGARSAWGVGLFLLGIWLLPGCGGSDKEPTGPDETKNPPSAEAILLTSKLFQSLQGAFFASLAQDTTTVKGQEGVLEIRGQNWDFQKYSQDSQLFVDGRLVVQKEKFPNIPVKGELVLSGAQEGTLGVDIVVVVQGLQFAATGTMTINEVPYDVADLIAAAAAAERGGG